MRRSWVIEVCATCDRMAQWPFCEHRPTGLVLPEAGRWTEPVTVYSRAKKRESSAAAPSVKASL